MSERYVWSWHCIAFSLLSISSIHIGGVHTPVRGQCIWAYHSWQYRHTWTPWPRKRHAHMMTLNTGLCRLSFMVKLNTTERGRHEGMRYNSNRLCVLLLRWELLGQRHTFRALKVKHEMFCQMTTYWIPEEKDIRHKCTFCKYNENRPLKTTTNCMLWWIIKDFNYKHLKAQSRM